MKETLSKLIQAAKDYRESKSVGNSEKLNIAIKEADKYLDNLELNTL